MMKMTKGLKAGLSLATLIAMTAQAWAAASCDSGSAAALKTAAVQQELMVAGLTCGDINAYNLFVLDYQAQLQKSDADLMAYFRARDGSEAGYDSYKTKLANLAAGKSSADTARYCSSAAHNFAAASVQGQTLDNFVSNEHLLIAAPEACALKYDADTDVAVAGVPPHDLPATPYGAVPAAPVPVYSAPVRSADPDRRQAYNDLPLPPRYRRSRADQDGYAYDPDAYRPDVYRSGAYGPPEEWLPRPHSRTWISAYNDN